MQPKILLIDGHSLLNRGFYALPLLTNQEGEYTNAVYGFLNIFFKLYDEEKPEHVIVAFDVHKPTFRHERYAAYKGTRKPMPEELRPQVPLLKRVLAAMSIHTVECPGYEADDVLGTLSAKADGLGLIPVVVTGDRDLLQLASDRVKIRIPKTKAGKTEVEDYFAADVLEKTGVTPRAYIDVKALMGDASDNIPGVPGIGEVTATKIIAQYGSVENAIARAAEIKPKKASENLAQYSEQALLSKMLATIVLDAPAELDEVASKIQNIFTPEAHSEFVRLEFKSFLPRFKKEENKTAEIKSTFRIIETEKEAAAYMKGLRDTPAAFFSVAHGDTVIGAGICPAEGEPVYINMLMEGASAEPAAPAQLSLEEFSQPSESPSMPLCAEKILSVLKPYLASDTLKITLDSKHEASLLRKNGVVLSEAVFDAMLAAYVLNVLKPPGIAEIALDYFGEEIPTLETLLDNKRKKSANRRGVSDLPTDELAAFACSAVSVLARVYPVMMEKLKENGQLSLYADMELPLAGVLLEMELAGIKVDPNALMEYGKTLEAQIARLTAEIHRLAGGEFNIQSPAQLGEILFGKLGLKGTKKTTQGWSTAADVLEKLASAHPIVPLILEYRTFTKLKSTYVDSLIPLIDPETGRVHSTFHQALTATGRLSSAEPNLQNIPVRMPLGRELRKAFIPPDGDTVFVDADYSQIELRILAHMAKDETLINAFLNGEDIHRLTASQVLRIPPEEVTPAQRNNAKAVNFGIVYGISAFGLSEDLKITKKEAERYIQGYFEKYPQVKTYLDDAVACAKREGYAATLYNRRRAMPELRSSNFNQRSFGERVAMNMPIQGSAADIIKIAMINVSRRLKKENLQSRLILQVHDELLLEVKKTELEKVKTLVKEEMENAAALDAPLVAEVHEGVNWYEAK